MVLYLTNPSNDSQKDLTVSNCSNERTLTVRRLLFMILQLLSIFYAYCMLGNNHIIDGQQ